MPSESSADAARQKLREGKALDRDELFSLKVAAEFVLGEASPRRSPQLNSLAVLEDLDHKKRELEEAKAAEHAVRSEIARLRRGVEQARTRNAVRQVEEQRRLDAENHRLYMKNLSGRALIESLAAHEPASEEEVVLLARMLHLRLEELYQDPRERSWFKLFKHMDPDGSGLISYVEFERLVRDEMYLSPDELSDGELRRVWVWIDRTGSGGLTSGEFAAFLRKGEVGGDGLSWRDRRWLQHKAKADEVRRARQEVASELSRAMAAAEPASEEELVTLSRKLNAVMAEADIRGWYKLFLRMDDAESGKVTIHQLERAVRLELGISPAKVPDRELLRLWKALDVEASGTLSAGEFGSFMRLGEAKAGPTWQERVVESKREQGAKVRAELNEKFGRETARELVGVDRAELAELRQLSSLLGVRARQLLPAVEVEADPTLCAWWRLFQDVNSDGSGCMRLAGFTRLVRDRLRLGAHLVPDRDIKAAWLAIDADGAGMVGKSAFGAFMRLGEENAEKRPWRERLVEAKKTAADEVRAQHGASAGRSALAARVEPLDPDAVTELSARLNARMDEVCPAGTSWYALFKRLAPESAGTLTYEDVTVLVRDSLQLPAAKLGERQLQRLWAALDTEGSGLLTAGEFGGFMRRGAKPREGPSWREKVSSDRKARCDQVRRELDGLSGRAYARAVAGEARASLELVRDVSARINAAASDVFGDARDGSPIHLFKGMDLGESGRIGLPDLTRLVRDVLCLPASAATGVTKSELRAVWLALDHESSGYIVSGEFVAFMRLGAPQPPKLGVIEKRQQMATHARAKLEVKRAKAMAAQAHDLWVETDAKAEELTRLRMELEMLQGGGVSSTSTASLPRIVPSSASKLNAYSTKAARSPRGFAGSHAVRPLATNLRETLRATMAAEGTSSS